jgi:2-dehydropantoate 2-reductase
VVQNDHARLTVPDDLPGRAFAGLYEGSDVEVKTTPDIVTALWVKLCGNIGSGPATALIGRSRGVIRNPEVAEFCRELVRECAAVGRAEGAGLPEGIAEKVVERHINAGKDATTSMLVDRLAGRPIEADVMTGAVVRLGARHGIDTPFNRAAHAMLMAVNVDGEG